MLTCSIARCSFIAAGVSLVAVTNCLAQDVASVEPQPFRSVASSLANGDVAFGTVLAATLTRTGDVIIADGAEARLTVLAPDGGRRNIGRRGEGPGEFSLPTWVGTCGTDSLFAWDLMKRAMLVFAPDGNFVRQFVLSGTAGTPVGAAVVSCASGVVAIIGQPSSPEKRTDRSTSAHREVFGALSIFDLTGKLIAQRGQVVAGEVSDTPGGNWLPRPMGAAGLLAVLPTAVVYGNTRTGALVRTDLRRLTTDTTMAGGPDRRPSAEHIAAAVDKALEFAPPPMRERMRPAFNSIEPPRILPKFSAIQTDPAGVLWVVTSSAGEGTLRLEAHGARDVKRFTLAGNMKLLAVGQDRLLCLAELADGDTELRLYRMQRR